MSISSHPAKRRRLANTSSALSKPFKSPLRTLQDVNQPAVEANNSNTHTPPLKNKPAAIIHRRHPHPQSTISNQTPEHLALQKHHSSLLLRLSHLRQSLDTAQQALKIASSTTDTDLESLIRKWKLASRDAAEEVYQGAKDRVNRMGGVGALRKTRRTKFEAGWAEDEAAGALNGWEGLSDEQREQVEIQREELEKERSMYASEGMDEKEEEEEEVIVDRDDDSLTMDMMLQSLNIDLDVIGYDKENQRWCD